MSSLILLNLLNEFGEKRLRPFFLLVDIRDFFFRCRVRAFLISPEKNSKTSKVNTNNLY